MATRKSTATKVAHHVIEDPWGVFLSVAAYVRRILLHSEAPGTGKTSAGRALAEARGYDYVAVTLAETTQVTDLLGHLMPVGPDEWAWHDGPIAAAIRRGRTVIALNDLPNGGADVQHVCYSLLEAGKNAVITLSNGEVLPIPNSVVIVASQNPKPEETLTPAVISRFQVVLDIGDNVSPMLLDALPDHLRSMVADHRMAAREAFALLDLVAEGCPPFAAVQAVLGTERARDYGDALAIALAS